MLFNYQGKKYELIMLCVTGSRMYGTHYEKGEHPLIPDYVSDFDYRGVFVPHEDEKLGLGKEIEQISPSPEKKTEIALNDELITELNSKGLNLEKGSDIVLFEVRKFIKMGMEQNPNILDMIFTDEEATIYKNSKANKILNNKEEFLSKNVINRFVGYAEQQLHRIKGHNKHINKRPKHNYVIEGLKKAYESGDINYNWINVNFSGKLAKFVTKKNQQEANLEPKLLVPYSLDNFQEEHLPEMSMNELYNYAKPLIVNYVTLKDTKGKKIKLSDQYDSDLNYRGFLRKGASFRKITNSFYNLFTEGNGFISKNNDIKNVEPENVGDFVAHCSVDKQRFTNDLDQVLEFWKWRTERNEKRSVLEEKFGYDTKHAGHLIRLMLGAKDLIKEGTYRPRLEGKRKEVIKSIIEGKYSYEDLLEKASKLKEDVVKNKNDNVLKDDSALDYDKVNKLLLSISYIGKHKKKLTSKNR